MVPSVPQSGTWHVVSESRVEIIPAVLPSEFPVPAIIAAAGEKASEHFLEFFAATIRNKNTRAAYVQAVAQFCRWCEETSCSSLPSGRCMSRPISKSKP